jgi:hypothetical protein
MPKIQTSCPNCQSPIVAELHQVVDVDKEPQLKEILLAGGLNFAQCQVCGFQGQLPVPIVYHDSKKELLFTFTPPDVGKTIEEKEAALAPLLKKIIDNLDPEDKKGYLFQPKAMLTVNSLVKNVLLEDGITEEMISEQQEKMKLLDLLFSKEGDALLEAVKENNERIDREFFALFAEIAQRLIASQDEESIRKVQAIQDCLLTETEIGKIINKESKEFQAASQALEALGENLSRATLLELVDKAPNQERIRALTSLVRPAMDYEFFQMLTEKIEKSKDEQRKDLVEKRNLMLKLTQEIDQQVQSRIDQARELINDLTLKDNIEQELVPIMNQIDQFFIQALSIELEFAEKENNSDRKSKLENILHTIQEITTPRELKVLDNLLSHQDDEEKLIKEIRKLDSEIVTRLNDYLITLITNYEEQKKEASGEDIKSIEEVLDKVTNIYNMLLRESMKMKFSS